MTLVDSQLMMEALMARKSNRSALVRTADQVATLKELAASRTAPLREVERANILLGYREV